MTRIDRDRAAEVGPGGRQVLFVQGAGVRVHEEWDSRLVESLRRELGAAYDVRYPAMPQEDDPSYERWSAAILRELAACGAGAVAVGHSVGGTVLIRTLAEHPDAFRPALVVLVAAPFVGEGGWPDDGVDYSGMGARLPADLPVHVVHGLDDETAPPAHAELYGRAIPWASMHLLPRRDHQLNDDLGEVADIVRAAFT